MTATAQRDNETPTKAMLDRLAAVDEPLVKFGHMNEIAPWLDAARVGGFELPPDALDLVTMALHLATLHERHVKPLEHRTVNVDRLLAGATTADILDADDAAAFARTRWERSGQLLIAAEGHLAGECLGVFGPIRDSLITGPMRETVATLLTAAGKAAEKLKRFGPDFPPALLAEGDAKEIETWRQSRHLQRDFDVLVTAWQTSWYQATCHQGHAGELGTQFNPSRPGGWFVWTAPDDVQGDGLKSGQDTEVLRIASAGSSYQLLSPGELMPLLAAIEATLPADSRPAWQLVRDGVCDG
jgi:hypothetical protein